MPISQIGRDVVTFSAGETIFTAGQAGAIMYVVVAGEVEIRQGERLLALARAGEPIGEMELIDHGGRSATATARTDCVLAPITERRFLYLIQETPQFALQVMRVLVERLRHAHGRAPAAQP
jgi:CRP-like cAMP-binding protein